MSEVPAKQRCRGTFPVFGGVNLELTVPGEEIEQPGMGGIIGYVSHLEFYLSICH